MILETAGEIPQFLYVYFLPHLQVVDNPFKIFNHFYNIVPKFMRIIITPLKSLFKAIKSYKVVKQNISYDKILK